MTDEIAQKVRMGFGLPAQDKNKKESD